MSKSRKAAMFTLNDRVSISKKRKRIGRGGSRGGTSGKGTKGQKARSGGARKLRAGFEGGQMPLHRRLPKRGFNNEQFRTDYVVINVEQLDKLFNTNESVTKESLMEKGLLKNTKLCVKVLGNGQLSKSLHITVDACSASAMEKIKKHGGDVQLIKGA